MAQVSSLPLEDVDLANLDNFVAGKAHEMWRRLRAGDLGHVDFFDAAARLAQLQTALATGRAVGSIDAAAVQAAAPLDESAAETIEEIFSARAEMHYAGGGGGDGEVSATERERVLGALKQLEKSRAKS